MHGKSQSQEPNTAVKYEFLRQEILDFSTFLEPFGLQSSINHF